MSVSSKSEIDYMERVALNNNMDVVENDNSTSTANITGTDIPSDPSVSSHIVSNLTHNNNKANTLTLHEAYIPSAQLTPPTIILYSSNICYKLPQNLVFELRKNYINQNEAESIILR